MPRAAFANTTSKSSANRNSEAKLQRAAIERAIDSLIELCDTLDGDPDLEPANEDGTQESDRPLIYAVDQTLGPRNVPGFAYFPDAISARKVSA